MILIEDLHQLFDLVIDNVSSPYFTSSQKDEFLRRGIQNYLNKYFNRQPDGHNAETTSNDVANIEDLIEGVELLTNNQGELLFVDIEAALGNRKVFRYLTVEAKDLDECDNYTKSRFVRHNDWISNQLNQFKKATDMFPTHRYFNGRLQVDPKEARAMRLTVVLQPLPVTLDDPTDSGVRGPNAIDAEFDQSALNEIVYLSLSMAGVSIREGDFYQLVEREGTKNE